MAEVSQWMGDHTPSKKEREVCSSKKAPRRRLGGKQPAPKAHSALADWLHLLVDFLGTSAFKVSTVSHKCKDVVQHDKQLWLAALQKQIKFADFKFPDAAAGAVFSHLSADVPSLVFDFCDRSSLNSVVKDVTLKRLTESMPSCLKRLSIQTPYFQGDFLMDLASQFPSNLLHLSLKSTLSHFDDDVFVQFSRQIPKQLEHLVFEIGYANIPSEAAFLSFLQHLPPGLKHLSLKLEEVLGGLEHMLPQLADRLSQLSSLKHLNLDLKSNDLDGEDIVPFLQKCPRKLASIQLDFSNTDFSSPSIVQPFEAFLNDLESPDTLGLIFEGCEDSISSDLMDVLTGNLPSTLLDLRLDFSACNCLDSHAERIGRALSACQVLQKLELGLRACPVGAGAVNIGNSLPSSLLDLKLNFYNSDLGDEGVTALAQGFPQHLQSLVMNCGGCFDMTSKGVQKLLEHIPPTTRELDLEFEWASLSGVKHCQFPVHVRQLALTANAMYQAHLGAAPFISKLALDLRRLSRMLCLKLDLQLCDLSLPQARRLVKGLPPQIQELELDLGGQVSARETQKDWNALLLPVQAVYGKGTKIPQRGTSSAEKRKGFQLVLAGA